MCDTRYVSHWVIWHIATVRPFCIAHTLTIKPNILPAIWSNTVLQLLHTHVHWRIMPLSLVAMGTAVGATAKAKAAVAATATAAATFPYWPQRPPPSSSSTRGCRTYWPRSVEEEGGGAEKEREKERGVKLMHLLPPLRRLRVKLTKLLYSAMDI